MQPAQTEERNLPAKITNRYIASELATLRDRSGKTGDYVGQRMGWSPSKVSRVEHGATLRGGDLVRLLQVLGATEPETQRILRIACSGTMPGAYQNAEGVLEWSTTVLPAAVQCQEYAWAIEIRQAELTRQPPEAAEAAVRATMRWQELATSQDFRIEALFDESCLARQFGPASVMNDQAAHMLALVDRPNVTIQVVPASAAGLLVVSSFIYVRFEGDHGRLSPADTVVQRHLHNGGVLDISRDTYHYHYAFGQLRDAALSPADTVKAIERSRKQWAARGAA